MTTFSSGFGTAANGSTTVTIGTSLPEPLSTTIPTINPPTNASEVTQVVPQQQHLFHQYLAHQQASQSVDEASQQSTVLNSSAEHTSHVSDAFVRINEIDDHPDRKRFLDQLLRFMEKQDSLITTCPTISNNQLDLFRIYLLVRDGGGFLKVTKNKAWNDIARTLGISASNSAAYSLRKHYIQSLLRWKCKFDRVGVDLMTILNQVRHCVCHYKPCFTNRSLFLVTPLLVEATTKKKPAPKISVPSPAGSSNSQDSFPSSGEVSPIPSMDGYPNARNPGNSPRRLSRYDRAQSSLAQSKQPLAQLAPQPSQQQGNTSAAPCPTPLSQVPIAPGRYPECPACKQNTSRKKRNTSSAKVA